MIAISMNSTSNWQACLKEHEAAVVRLSMYPVWVSTRRNGSLPRSDPRPSAAQPCSGWALAPAERSRPSSPRAIVPSAVSLDQASNAAVKTKGSLFQALYRRIRGSDKKKQKSGHMGGSKSSVPDRLEDAPLRRSV